MTEPGATAQRPQLSRVVLAHAPRQLRSWLIWDVRQNMKYLLALSLCFSLIATSVAGVSDVDAQAARTALQTFLMANRAQIQKKAPSIFADDSLAGDVKKKTGGDSEDSVAIGSWAVTFKDDVASAIYSYRTWGSSPKGDWEREESVLVLLRRHGKDFEVQDWRFL